MNTDCLTKYLKRTGSSRITHDPTPEQLEAAKLEEKLLHFATTRDNHPSEDYYLSIRELKNMEEDE